MDVPQALAAFEFDLAQKRAGISRATEVVQALRAALKLPTLKEQTEAGQKALNVFNQAPQLFGFMNAILSDDPRVHALAFADLAKAPPR